MSLDFIHNQLINHYRKSSLHKKTQRVKRQSVVRKSYLKKHQDSDKPSSFQDFLKNQQKIATEAEPLIFRELPRNLKVYFSGPPTPPPILQQIPYTYQIVPKVPFKMPKQKKGIAAQWVVQQSYFIQSTAIKQKQFNKKNQILNNNNTDLGSRFRNAIKKLTRTMKQQNLSLSEIIQNKGLIKKPYNYYNSHQFFELIKKGDKDAFRLLNQNSYLAYDIDQLKMTALHWTARAGYSQIVNILTTKYNANVHAKDNYGRTPLHLAVARKNIQCIIRIFIEGGKLVAMDNNRQSVRSVAPDVYTKFLLQKLEEIRFIIRSKGIKDIGVYKKQLQNQIRQSLDSSSLYF